MTTEAELAPALNTAPVEVKTCARCERVVSLRRFGWLKQHSRGRPEIHRDSWCSDCRREYKRTPSQRAKTAERQRIRRLKDPVFRKAHNDKGKKYYQLNKAAISAKQKAKRGLINGKGVNLAWLASRLKTKFGISLDEYYAMAAKQDNKCAICHCHDTTKTRRLSVDHDHTTDSIRELLCHHCNTGLGNFKDDIGLLFKAIQYLIKHQQRETAS